MPDFVHLHVHTQYSLLDGAIRLDPLFERVKRFGMPAVAITDHGTMFGVLEFYEKAKKAGIHPIIGCECYVAPRSIKNREPRDYEGMSHLVLLAKDRDGYKNLCRLATIAQLKGFYYKPRIDKALLAEHSRGLIALSACLHGEIPRHILDHRIEKAESAALEYSRIFGERNFFLEIQNNGIEEQEVVNQGLMEIGRRLSIPLVATNDCHYLDKKDVRAHDVLLCIQTAKTVKDSDRLKFRTDQLYFKSGEEMVEDLGGYEGAVENTLEIASRCHVDFDFGTYHFPCFETPDEKDVDSLFEEKTRRGFERRIRKIAERKAPIDREAYEDRLENEISVIKRMGFSGYFLIVADFIAYAKQNGIPVGPGRGSAAGSIVAYSLGITDLDPLEHGLIFERFLNPDRKSMPDIDVDFCIHGREDVFKYVVNKYGGGDYVAQIITFGKLKTRAVIRDVGRALDIPLREVDSIAKMVPDVINISLDEALEKEPKLRNLIKTREDIAELIEICRVLEGLPRHASTHAAGVVISDRPLTDYMPLFKGKKGEVVTQFDMKRVERIGLVKFDFLGLRNLTVIEKTLQQIKAQGKAPPDLSNLDMKDASTFELLAKGDTTGVFQLESSGMKDLMVRMRPESFDDIIALVALYRPGPLDSGMATEYVERKHGRKPVEYITPELEPILGSTYGVIVYQEQVMQIAARLADYSMAEADELRKAMGKKIEELMAKHEKRFIDGAVAKGIGRDVARVLFSQMRTFGRYGFNKSHSAAYALIAYQTAFLKAHFPVEFMASILTSEMHTTDGVMKYIAECKARGIKVLPPDVNESEKEFTVKDGKIRFGLLAVKNVGEGAIDEILMARKEGRFDSIFDFCERVNMNRVNRRVIESLIKCGAFDSTRQARSQLMAVLEEAMEYGQVVQREKDNPQMGLFMLSDLPEKSLNLPKIPAIPEWDEKMKMGFEKEALGFYVTGHPLHGYEKILTKVTNATTSNISERAEKEVVFIGGMVAGIKTIISKKGEPMAFITLEDLEGSVEVVVFPSVFALCNDLLKADVPVVVQGEIQKDENAVKLLAEKIIPLDRAEETLSSSIHISLDVERTGESDLEELKSIISRFPGGCPAFLHFILPGRAEAVMALPEQVRLKPGAELKAAVEGFLGYRAVETKCSVH